MIPANLAAHCPHIPNKKFLELMAGKRQISHYADCVCPGVPKAEYCAYRGRRMPNPDRTV
jgi:hypothetical protein